MRLLQTPHFLVEAILTNGQEPQDNSISAAVGEIVGEGHLGPQGETIYYAQDFRPDGYMPEPDDLNTLQDAELIYNFANNQWTPGYLETLSDKDRIYLLHRLLHLPERFKFYKEWRNLILELSTNTDLVREIVDVMNSTRSQIWQRLTDTFDNRDLILPDQTITPLVAKNPRAANRWSSIKSGERPYTKFTPDPNSPTPAFRIESDDSFAVGEQIKPVHDGNGNVVGTVTFSEDLSDFPNYLYVFHDLEAMQRVKIVLDALKGVQRHHDRGFVHCDIKPNNIIVFPDSNNELAYGKISDLKYTQNKRGRQRPSLYSHRYRNSWYYNIDSIQTTAIQDDNFACFLILIEAYLGRDWLGQFHTEILPAVCKGFGSSSTTPVTLEVGAIAGLQNRLEYEISQSLPQDLSGVLKRLIVQMLSILPEQRPELAYAINQFEDRLVPMAA